MPSTATSILDGLSTSVAVKPPCIAVTSANITLAGLQTIGSVTLVENDRVLVVAQNTASENGIYMASTGSWTRAKDFDGNRDVVQGTRVLVRNTGVSGVEYELTTANPIVIGTTALTFALRYGADAVYDQTQAEIDLPIVPVDTGKLPGVVSRYAGGISYANLRAAAYEDKVVNAGRDSLFNGVNVGRGRNTGNTRGTAIGFDALQSTGAGEDNTAVGYQAMTVCSGLRNTALGSRSMVVATSAYQNTAVGNESLKAITTGSRCVAVGESALFSIVDFAECTAVGAAALYSCNSHKNTAVGREAGYYISSGEHNVVIGYDAGINQTTGDNNTFVGTFAGQGQQTLGVGSSTSENCVAVGHSAMAQSTTSIDTVAVGVNALTAITTGHSSVAIGKNALAAMTTGNTNVAVGRNAGDAITTGVECVAVGDNSLPSCTTSTGNIAIGKDANSATTGNLNTAIGYQSLNTITTESNCSALGNAAQVTGSNQVQLGNSSTTTYAYGAVQNRSDARDKADIRDTVLGLEFILQLRPVDFRWDYRDDYGWGPKDGSKKRGRFHHGLIAQEVKATCDELGVDFGGFQDHGINGGKDVLSLGYEEYIAPLIKSAHQMHEMIVALQARVAELESRQ